MKYLIINSFLVGLVSCFSQEAFATVPDTIIVGQDPRLEVLSQKQKIVNKKQSMMAGNGLYRGFRIQVISTNQRDQAFRIKAELLTNFPDHKAYIIYQSPNFKVRIGNFIKKEDAEMLKSQLNKFYPRGVYIVDDAVEYNPREDELNLQP
ncbi:MAG: SPOR domain-containing protein [Chitinophagaceae bacterium]|nr:SPOR domain-containing protein [Chitinophagaceae bacterium]MCA6486589.1 SPOR domain-containing protein [Chitinophagaceae bacterium]